MKIVTQYLTHPDCVSRKIGAFFLIGLMMAVTTQNGNAQVAVRDAMGNSIIFFIINPIMTTPEYERP